MGADKRQLTCCIRKRSSDKQTFGKTLLRERFDKLYRQMSGFGGEWGVVSGE
jgi:hypothetical protein